MSLSDRLAEAAAARETGTFATTSPPAPQPELALVDLTEPTVEPGVPAPCPDCRGAGYLERIDLSSRRQHERCRACGACWSRPV